MQLPNPALEPTWPSARGQGAWSLRWRLVVYWTYRRTAGQAAQRQAVGRKTITKSLLFEYSLSVD
jgi:hypothetical protein